MWVLGPQNIFGQCRVVYNNALALFYITFRPYADHSRKYYFVSGNDTVLLLQARSLLHCSVNLSWWNSK